ncbi:MAG: ketoacyl-ACP synthase III [Bacillota bacterium]|nr:ketoacyl-ACP synthase III [Bacillota bacterium]
MATGVLRNAGIKGIACAVPDNIKRSEEYNSTFGADSVQKFINMTGIKKRHVALDRQCTSDLCYVAAKNLLEKLNWEPSSIDALILITQTPDYAVPPSSCVLQHRLGLSEDCITFDVNLGCSAYVYGVWMAATMISTQNLNRVLLLVGDTSNFGINPNDSATAMLFGDGGTATAFERTEGKEIKYVLKTKGSGFKSIIVPAGHARSRGKSNMEASDYALSMNGSEIFTFTITDVPKTIKNFLQQYNISDDNIDKYVFHQANLFILKHLAKKLNIPMEKVAVSIDRYGNTSGESIPLTLVDAYGTKKSSGTARLLLSGFGIGLSWGCIYLDIDTSVFLPMIYTNDYFRGG